MTTGANMINELNQAVARAAKLPPAQAALAVKAMLQFLTGRLPSRLVGELHTYLKMPKTTPHSPQPTIALPHESNE
ncbi:hypothetical protein BN873_360088 [Candidatus Competibacter denitrificans Run_A_D11]|uniref:DUF2267 domain-containing protein n=2 Tax=Candidatus Competibacter TaxID=221279 RepID=W6M8L5_9GAMM|nr:hypothetical protein BN873_360088 [Candidatus Competibacter denitrificans Run_A_D11]